MEFLVPIVLIICIYLYVAGVPCFKKTCKIEVMKEILCYDEDDDTMPRYSKIVSRCDTCGKIFVKKV